MTSRHLLAAPWAHFLASTTARRGLSLGLALGLSLSASQAQWQPDAGGGVPDPTQAPQLPGGVIQLNLPADTPQFILQQYPASTIFSQVTARPATSFTQQLNMTFAPAAGVPWLVVVPFNSTVGAGNAAFGDVVTAGGSTYIFDINGAMIASKINGAPPNGAAIFNSTLASNMFISVGENGRLISFNGPSIINGIDNTNITVVNQGDIIGNTGAIINPGDTTALGNGTVQLFNTETGIVRATTGPAVQAGANMQVQNQGSISGMGALLGGGGNNMILNEAGASIMGNGGSGINLNNPAINTTSMVYNMGTIFGSAGAADGGSGVNIAGGGDVYNWGTITSLGGAPVGGVFNPGVGVGTGGGAVSGTVYNYGTITANGANPGVWVNGTGTNVVVNDGGTIAGGLSGAAVLGGAGSDSVINQNNALLSGGAGSNNAIALGAGPDRVSTDNWSQIQGNIDGGAGSDTLEVNLSGISPRVAASLRSAAASPNGSATVRGTTYSWTNMETVAFNTISFEGWGGTPNQRSVGAALDSLSIRPDAEIQQVYDDITTAGQASFGAVANSLSPQRYEAANLIAVTQSTFRYRNLQRRFDNIFNGQDRLSQVDTSGVVVRNGGMAPSMSDANTRLASLSLSHRTMSDVPGLALGGFDKNIYEPKDMVPALFPPDVPDLEMEPEHHWGLWLSGTGIFADGDGNSDISGFDYDAAGAMIGADYRLLPQLSLGLFGGYDYTNADLDTIGSSMVVNSYTVGTYAAWAWEGWHADGTFAYTFDDYRNERRVVLPGGFDQTANSSPGGNHFTAAGGFGYDFTFGKSWDEEFRIGPMASIQYTNVTVDGFSETGINNLGLNVSEQNPESLRSMVGGRFSYVARLRKATLIPHLYASWVHEFYEDPYTITASFQQPGFQSFGVTTSGTGRDFALVGGGMDALFFDFLTAFIDYDAQLGQEDFFAQEVTGGVRFDF